MSLTLNAVNEADGSITLIANAESLNPKVTKNADVFVALYKNGLITQVKAGENNGRELKHDYVMRQLFGAYQLNDQHQFSKHFALPNSWKSKDAGAVIFVQDSSNGEIIQSLALDFCR